MYQKGLTHCTAQQPQGCPNHRQFGLTLLWAISAPYRVIKCLLEMGRQHLMPSSCASALLWKQERCGLQSQSVTKYLTDSIEEELGSKLPRAPCYSEAWMWLSQTRETRLPLSRKEEPSWMLKPKGGIGFRYALSVKVCCCLSSPSHCRAADWTPSWSRHFYAWAVWAV